MPHLAAPGGLRAKLIARRSGTRQPLVGALNPSRGIQAGFAGVRCREEIPCGLARIVAEVRAGCVAQGVSLTHPAGVDDAERNAAGPPDTVRACVASVAASGRVV